MILHKGRKVGKKEIRNAPSGNVKGLMVGQTNCRKEHEQVPVREGAQTRGLKPLCPEGLDFHSETISKVTAKGWGMKVGAREASGTCPKEQKRDCAGHNEEARPRMETAGLGGASWPVDR